MTTLGESHSSDRRFNPGCGCLQSAQPKVWFGLNSRILNSGHFRY
ncbi:hypothetical protein LEMLEM_LOCUS27856 [Lemmus lemmus]